MQEFINSLKDSFFSISPYLVIFFVLYMAFEFFLYKKRNPKETKEDLLGLSKTDEQLHNELERIKEKFGNDEKVGEVDAVAALYIASNWDRYNLFGSEKGTVLFERIKELGDTVDVLPQEEPNKTLEEPKQNWQILEDGTARMTSEKGYVDFKDGRLVATKVFGQEPEVSKKNAKPKQKENKSAEKQERAQIIQEVQEAFKEEDEEEESHYKMKTISPFSNGVPMVEKIKVKKSPTIPKEEPTIEAVLPQDETQVFLPEEESQEKVIVAEEIISPIVLAQEISGTKKKTTTPKISEYDLQYVFDNYQNFCRNIFLSECDTNFMQRFQKYIHFVAEHQFVFYDKDETKMYVFVDSFILSLSRMIKKENRELFLSTFYTGNDFNLDNLSTFVEKFAAQINFVCDDSFVMSWKKDTKTSFVLPRGLKAKKTFCGQFIIFNFRKQSTLLIGDIVKSEENICEVISLKASEFDAIKGIKLKPRNYEEIKQNVL